MVDKKQRLLTVNGNLKYKIFCSIAFATYYLTANYLVVDCCKLPTEQLLACQLLLIIKKVMPTKETIKRAERDKRRGKSPGTQAGEFVREEIENIRKGEHGARSAKQAIAIGLSEARRAGVKLKPPKKGQTSAKTRRSAKQAYEKGQRHEPVSKTRSRARERALKREPTSSASHTALSKQAHAAAKKRSAADRSAAARRASRTKGPRKRSAAAKKAARTRAKHRA